MKTLKETEIGDFECNHKMTYVEVEHSGRKQKRKLKIFDKDTLINSSVEVVEDKKEDDTTSGNEEMEGESKGVIAGMDENDEVLVGYENKREVKKRKKEKRDHMMFLDSTETNLEKKKKKNKEKNHAVVAAGNEEREVEKVEEKRNDTKARNKDKKRKRKDKKGKMNKMDDGEEIVDIQSGHEDGLVQGKRFSNEEDELIKKAVSDYIKAKKLGDDGLKMILRCKSCPEVRGCWQEIGAALPWRPTTSIYFRAHRLYEQGERNWTVEEVEYIRKTYKQCGPKWRKMADKLGKCPAHVRSAFQRYQLGNLRKGKWSQDEFQTLFELVNKDLQEKVFEEKKSMYGMLKDNISWEAISQKIGTRNSVRCCDKWYRQLTSPMVAEGKWADVDDYWLLMVLVEIDASCEDEVDWDNLLEHRSGDLCRKRWLQMVRHLGEHGNKSFSEQVEVLSNRYCPDLADVREAMDARAVVD